MPVPEALPIIIEGQIIKEGDVYQFFCNGEQYTGVIAEVAIGHENHTIAVILENITEPESAKNQHGVFVFDTLQKTWRLG